MQQEQQLVQLSELDAPQYHQQQQAFQLALPVPHWRDLNDEDNDSLSSANSAGRDGGCSSISSLGGVNAGGIPGHDGTGTGCSSSSCSGGASERRTKKRNLSNPQTSRWLTCQVCRISKTKCDGNFPCSRCWNRMCFCCRPQTQILGQATTTNAAGAGGRKRRRRRALPEEVEDLLEEQKQDEAMAVEGSSPYLHLVFLRARPQPLVDSFLQAFARVHQEQKQWHHQSAGGGGGQRMDRAKAVRLLRCWQRRSAYVGADISNGIVGALVRLFQVTAEELDGGQGGSQGGGEEGREEGQSTEEMVKAGERLKHSRAFYLADEAEGEDEREDEAADREEDEYEEEEEEEKGLNRRPPQLKMSNKKDTTGVLMAVSDGSFLHWASNAAFDRLFLGVAGLLNESVARRRLPILLFASLLHPQDREVWFRSVILALFTSSPPPSPVPPAPAPAAHQIKAISQDGRISSYILSVTPIHASYLRKRRRQDLPPPPPLASIPRSSSSPPSTSSFSLECSSEPGYCPKEWGKEEEEECGMLIQLKPAPELNDIAPGGSAAAVAAAGGGDGGGGGNGEAACCSSTPSESTCHLSDVDSMKKEEGGGRAEGGGGRADGGGGGEGGGRRGATAPSRRKGQGGGKQSHPELHRRVDGCTSSAPSSGTPSSSAMILPYTGPDNMRAGPRGGGGGDYGGGCCHQEQQEEEQQQQQRNANDFQQLPPLFSSSACPPAYPTATHGLSSRPMARSSAPPFVPPPHAVSLPVIDSSSHGCTVPAAESIETSSMLSSKVGGRGEGGGGGLEDELPSPSLLEHGDLLMEVFSAEVAAGLFLDTGEVGEVGEQGGRCGGRKGEEEGLKGWSCGRGEEGACAGGREEGGEAGGEEGKDANVN